MMRLGLVVAMTGAVTIYVGWDSGQHVLFLLAAFTLLSAVTTVRSVGMSTFLQILIAFFGFETIVLSGCVYVSAYGHWPSALEGERVPSTVVMTVALFSILCHLTFFMPVVRKTLAITDRYFRATDPVRLPFGLRIEERTLAAAAIMILVLLNQIEVYLTVLLSFVSSSMMNALNEYKAGQFWSALLVDFPLYISPLLLAYFVEFLLSETLFIRWRRFLTNQYSARWLDYHNHYGMMLAGVGTDNPDQRIQEDIPRFINGGQFGGLGVYNFSINLISNLSSLVSFAIILWALSERLTIPGTSSHIPGLLLWYSIIYAIIGTGITAFIGRPLAALAFARQHYEANFRFGLARLREYSEQIALLVGEETEKSILAERFVSIVRNFYSIVYVKAFLTTFIQFFSNASQFIPYIMLGPFYFARTATLGDLTQASIAFGNVNASLTFFINYYANLAEFKSVLDRLTTFDASLDAVRPHISIARTGEAASRDFMLSGVEIRLPDGKPLSEPFDLHLAANENVLLSGPSGSGKSTLFRVISGIWPYRDGTVAAPDGAAVMVLPQKPYLPIGTLLAAICYPRPSGAYDVTEVTSVLRDVGLSKFVDQLDIDDNWSQRLSGGEQQRVAIARAILAKPKWLFLDEATAAMDPKLESEIYRTLAAKLPGTTIVSIAHRDTLAQHHERHLTLVDDGTGRFVLGDTKVAAE